MTRRSSNRHWNGRPHRTGNRAMSDLSSLPLSKIDPAEAWKPWQPVQNDPWSLKWAGHLYRRAAFGANWPELQESLKQGHAATLDSLLSGKPLLKLVYDAPTFNQFMDQLAPKSGGRYRSFDDTNQIQAW